MCCESECVHACMFVNLCVCLHAGMCICNCESDCLSATLETAMAGRTVFTQFCCCCCQGRELLMRMLEVFVLKFKTIARVQLPQILQKWSVQPYDKLIQGYFFDTDAEMYTGIRLGDIPFIQCINK